MITLRFVTCADAVSAGIRAFEYGFWASHVECLMPDGTLLGAHYDGGVQARAHDYDKGKFTKELYLQVALDEPTMFYAFLTSQLGKPYDITAIEALVFDRDWNEADSWFCSELQAAALAHAGFFPSELATTFSKITPRDLLLILSARVVGAATGSALL